MSQLQVTGEAKIRDIQGPVVANSGVITALDGAASQYVRGDGTLADFPTSSGGGSSVSYYLNSSVSQGTIGGVAYRELSKEPIIGTGTDIAISSNGYVASYITDANDPDVTIVPGGNFNCEFYFSVNNNTGNPTTYAELYKYDGTTFTLLGTSAGVPESINQGTTIAPYYFAIPVATAALSVTDRLAIRIYVSVDGRTVTLHTENSHLCQVVTTLSKGMVSLNNLTDQSQYLATGTAGTNFAIVSTGDTHTFNLPVASATNTGKLSSTDWSTFNGKVPYTGATANVDLGANGLIAGAISSSGIIVANGLLGALGGLDFQKGNIPSLFTLGDVILYSEATTNNVVFRDNASKAKLEFNNSTQTYTFPAITGTLALLEGTQTFSGAKTFDEGISLKSAAFPTPATGYSSIGGNSFGITIITKQSSTIYTSNLGFPAANRTFTFPNADGTIALTSNLSSYVPYSGATTDVSLGNNSLLAKFVMIEGDGTFGGILSFKQYASSFTSTTDHTNIYATDTDKLNFNFFQVGGGKSFTFNVSGLTASANRTYTMPDASGTLALTSNLSAYLPLTGGTLTGALSGTSATFSGSGLFGGSTNAGNAGTFTLSVGIPGTTAGGLQLWAATNQSSFLQFGDSTTAADNYRGYVGYNHATDTLSLGAAGADRLTIASTGAATFNISSGGYNATFNGTSFGGLILSNGGTANSYFVGESSLLSIEHTTAINLRTNNENRVRITSGGNVGIGTSSPSNFDGVSFAGPFFDVAGIMQIKGTSANTIAALQFGGTTFRKALIYSSVGTDDPYLAFATASSGSSSSATERMRITSDGAPKFRVAGAALRDTAGVVPEIAQAANVHCLVLSQKTSDFSQDGFGVLGIAVDRAATAGYAFAGWYSSITGDKEFSFRGDGNGYCDGSWTGGGADYAEYFEWEDGNINNEDRRGMSVSLVNNKIKIAEQGEAIIGVISGNPSIVGDGAWNKWSGKYLKDDFGSYILDEEGNRTLNPDYDENVEYVPREKRKEWSIVGLMGKLRIKKGQETMPTWIKMRDISQNVEEWLIK